MSDFKNTGGVWFTKALFLQIAEDPTRTALYSLSFDDVERDGKVYPGFFRLYLELEDPTEYLVATELFGGLEHWDVLVQSARVGSEIENCRHWLNLKLKSLGMKKIIEQSQESFQAARYLVDQNWLDKGQKKKAKSVQANVEGKVTELYSDDFERVFNK